MHELSREAASNTWFTDAPADAMAQLCQRRANINLIETILFARVLTSRGPAPASILDLNARVAQLRSISPGALAVLMTTPDYDVWVKDARDIRKSLESELKDDSIDSVRQSAIGPQLEDVLTRHSQFELALALVTKTSTSGMVDTPSGKLMLPLWGVVLETGAHGRTSWSLTTDTEPSTLVIGPRSWTVTYLLRGDVSEMMCQPGARARNRVHHRGMDIAIACSQDEPGMSGVSECFQAGLDLIARCWPSMALDLAMAISLIVCRQDTSIDPEALTDTPWGQIECLVPTTELEAAESLVGQLSAKVAPEMIPDSVDDDRLARLIAHAFGVERSIRLLKRHCLIAPRDERAVARLEQLRISARSICTSSDLLIFRSKASESTRSVFASLEHHCGNMA